ncbi:MAG: Tex family protein [Bacilli bacterium]
MIINNVIAEQLKLNPSNVESAVNLMDQGGTVPFIARYRKEVTGGLTDENLRDIQEKLVYFRSLEDRKKTVFASLQEQNVTDPELLKKIEDSLALTEVEDLYRPYKPKKVTRASKAKKAGLDKLSQYLLKDTTGNLEEEAKKYLTTGYETTSKAIQGAFDILAEQISDNPNYRVFIKDLALKKGLVTSEKIAKCDIDTYDNYAKYSKRISDIKGYNVLAINRGVNKKALTKKLVYDDDIILDHLNTFEIPLHTPYKKQFEEMILDSYNRLIKPSVDNDVFSDLLDKASDEAIEEFKISLKATLLVPPLRGKRILGFDPGFSHGCKLAFIDENGKVLDTFVLNNPFMNERSIAVSKSQLQTLLLKNKTFTIALGNGTASRESQKMLEEMKKDIPALSNLEIVVVSEAGASIYSATALAQKEFPDYEPNLRSAVSIARRLEDPLAELVKIPPEAIGVGQYQYDIDPKKLSLALKGVVEDTVNYVGVILNTASASLLSYVSGINTKIADSIVKYREENGAILSRSQLKKVPNLGPKAFQNCAGFLRIPDSKEPLDNTAVHPESYPIAKEILKEYKISDNLASRDCLHLKDEEITNLAAKLNVGVFTLKDILKELVQPSRDPRDSAKVAHLTEGVTDIKDLKVGAIMEGTIRNVAGFGFFVDIGVEINGLVHISEMADHYVSDPHTIGKPGDIIKVKVIGVDLARKRISLSLKGVKQDV